MVLEFAIPSHKGANISTQKKRMLSFLGPWQTILLCKKANCTIKGFIFFLFSCTGPKAATLHDLSVCLSVCLSLKNALPGGLETFGQKVYR